jgi:hypothetical protein
MFAEISTFWNTKLDGPLKMNFVSEEHVASILIPAS